MAVAVGVLIGGFLNFPAPIAVNTKSIHKNKLNKLITFIDSEYVDAVDTDSIVDLALSNILDKLDPHSVYIPKEEQSAIAESMKGDFVGVGINFYMYNDSLAVINTIENGPSQKAGILAGDRILYAGKSKIYGRKLPSDSLYRYLKGAENSDLTLTVFRKSQGKTINLNLKRAVVPIKSVDIGLLIAPKTGYIKINRFAESTYDEFLTALLQLKKQGMQTLIIDVRENGGGYMEQATAIADELLPKDKLVVFTKNKKGRIDRSFATEKGNFEKGNVYVLIDENSASASEILAGAVQDNDRGTIVGRRSFGKGLVQREMNFADGSAVRLTIARYFTPTGRSIQKPYKKGSEEYYKAFEKRFASGELYSKDSIKVNDSLKFKTPKGKVVYGGGGIVPDIFVALNPKSNTEAISYILQSGTIGFFVFEQLDKNRKMFENLQINDLQSKIIDSDLFLVKFQKHLSKNGLNMDWNESKSIIKNEIYAEFLRQIHGKTLYFKHILKSDDVVNTILKKS